MLKSRPKSKSEPKKVENGSMGNSFIKNADSAVRLRAKAKALDEEAKRLKDEANSILIPLMASHGISRHSVGGVGTVTLKTVNGSKLNQTKLRENMLIWGIPPDDVSRIIDDSSSTYTSTYTEFRSSK